ncbi:hypothetical protein BDZ97DRAFT_1923398 [Flammula alnicola]|nr:hypothetical protein BDZ97DRAFT_1923398 [Flammula alnicola]
MSSHAKQPPISPKASPPKASKRSKRNPEFTIPTPAPDAAPRSIRRTNRSRAEEKIIEKEEQLLYKLAQKYKEQAQVIRAPFTRRSLQKNADVAHLQEICNKELGPDRAAQHLSAQVIDRKGEPILFYFGYRITPEDGKAPPEIKLKDQYLNRTKAYFDSVEETKNAKKVFDGIHHKKMESYHVQVQDLVSAVPLHSRKDPTRHEDMNSIEYTVEGEDAPKTEDAGVVHGVQGWIQQGQKKKGLYLSGDISYSSSSMTNFIHYFLATRSVARALAIMFETVFPDIYAQYQEAFEAGVWLTQDPGPFLGRAIIYKLQGKLHKDRNDVGPSASFPAGYFTGGEMLFPQLGAKFT